MQELRNDLERAAFLQNLLISRATGGSPDEFEYQAVRKALLENRDVADIIPAFVRTCRDLSQFWAFIKRENGQYEGRRQIIWTAFSPLLERLEGKATKPSDGAISEGLRSFDSDGVHAVWTKALERRETDPDGAITSARSLLESVCKHVLDGTGIAYSKNGADLPELYKLVSKELNLAPNLHSEEVFKQILGGVTSVVHGLGAMRNRLGDAHGQGKAPVRPAPRHAQLAVNLAGSTALFIVETWEARKKSF